jgi:hypothetical protein
MVNGLISNINKTIYGSNYLFYYKNFNMLIAANINITNISENLSNYSHILELGNLPENSITLEKNNLFFAIAKVIFTSVSSINISNCEIKGISFYITDYTTTNFIEGFTDDHVAIELHKCNVKKEALSIIDYFQVNFKALVSYCVGTSNYYLTDFSGGTFTKTCDLIFSRNILFKGVGVIQGDYTCNELLNDYNNGATVYRNLKDYYSTSTAYRDSGAGYSIEIINNNIDGVPTYYPYKPTDTTWLHIPASGIYSVTAYCAYTTVSGGYLGDPSDITTAVDVINDVPELFYSNNISTDTSSTWHNITPTGKLKITCTITANKAQYCPIRLALHRNIYGTTLYFDPKVEVTSV